MWKYERLFSQRNLEKKEQSWRHHSSLLQTVLQSYSHQNNIVWAQKQIHRSMEQNRDHRNKPMHLWSINLQQRRQEYNEEKTVSSVSGAGKTGKLYVKEYI